MKRREWIFEQLRDAPHFDKEMFAQIGSELNVGSATIDSYINKALKHKEIVPLRNGIYVTSSFLEGHSSKLTYSFYIANVLRKPSYVSMWSALDYYGMTMESIKTIMSVTTRVTRGYRNKVGNFKYRSLARNLFSDYMEQTSEEFNFTIATPAKALFDLIYFETTQFRTPRPNIIHDLRLDLSEFGVKDKKRFKELISETGVMWNIQL